MTRGARAGPGRAGGAGQVGSMTFSTAIVPFRVAEAGTDGQVRRAAPRR